MAGRICRYRFDNPNPADTAAGALLKLLVEANLETVRAAVRKAAGQAAASGAGSETGRSA